MCSSRLVPYLTLYTGVMDAFDTYMRPVRVWYQAPNPDMSVRTIVDSSAEFGLHESPPIYSGGLGILAGDHCKQASDLGCPSSASASSIRRAISGSKSTPTAGRGD